MPPDTKSKIGITFSFNSIPLYQTIMTLAYYYHKKIDDLNNSVIKIINFI